MRIEPIIAAGLFAATASFALAQSAEDRFSLENFADGYVRMDRQTGEMSICKEQSGQLVCKLAADERSAFEGEVDRLQGAVDALERRVTALESERKTYLPSDAEVDKSIDTMQRFLRGFMDVVKEFDKNGQPLPDRT